LHPLGAQEGTKAFRFKER